ncbi:hypothetical protein AWB80_04027 [Caballeronia pedi]|uniref:Uncharacterized protein n=1 Tax=Caballeronia pedi TaxID=1777141 RepID=A0A158BSA6_9BURK|nr:hypothetical protein [Caballeronia pedi]SAK72965.1 hypothetical protein AWB80_04027 [Caballeronia pedi]
MQSKQIFPAGTGIADNNGGSHPGVNGDTCPSDFDLLFTALLAVVAYHATEEQSAEGVQLVQAIKAEVEKGPAGG